MSRRDVLLRPVFRQVFSGSRAAILASSLSLAIGLFFIFVRAPHPWGWEGIDHYRDLGLALARGEGYQTLDRIWGYPYFLAAFYRAFGDRQWIPLLVQALLNATIPVMVFVEARRRIDERTAVVAALLTGVLSFNTIYASTQGADALCTVLFVGAVVCFGSASSKGSTWLFAASGLLAGVALLLRPNLLLFPLCLAAADLVIRGRRGWQAKNLMVFLLAAAALWLPWPIRNYRLTDRFMPATTHGGVQLWYGSLQVGEYFEHWFDNPRAQLESSPFDYSLPDPRPLTIVTTPMNPAVAPNGVTLTYWTSREPGRKSVRLSCATDGACSVSVPTQPAQTIVYYYFDATWTTPDRGTVQQSTPVAGSLDPLRHVVTADHFGDLDLNDDVLDVFDVVRLVRHEVWQEPLPEHPVLDLDGDGRVTLDDLDFAAGTLTVPAQQMNRLVRGLSGPIAQQSDRAIVVLKDGSTITVPRISADHMTELEVTGSDKTMAANLVRSARSFASLTLSPADVPALAGYEPQFVLRPEVNRIFSRAEPLWMDRYTQLAMANITRAPGAFALSCLRRVLRMFFTRGSDDKFRAAQFGFSRYIYGAATVLSVTYALLFAIGVVVAWRHKRGVAMLLLPVVYIPATTFMLLTNLRHLVTAQPFIFIFVATAVVSMWDALASRGMGRWRTSP